MKKDTPTKEEVWIRVVEAYVSSSNSVSKTGGTAWADYYADEYEKRFNK
jgi:hypothetical protein